MKRWLRLPLGGASDEHERGEELRLHLGLGFLFVALLLQAVFAVGINVGDKQNALAVRRPRAPRLRSRCWDLTSIAGKRSRRRVEILQPNLRPAVFGRFKDEAFAIGRKSWSVFAGAASRSESARFASGDRHDPQMRRAGVGVEAHVDRAEGDPFASGRDNRLTDAFELHHVFEAEGALVLRKCRQAAAE